MVSLGVASFRMFDEDGNGELSVAEVEAMFMRIAKVAEGGALSDDTKADTREVIRQIFLRFDTDKVLHHLTIMIYKPSSAWSSHFSPTRADRSRWKSSRPALPPIRPSAATSSSSEPTPLGHSE